MSDLQNFYPRSPCGERPNIAMVGIKIVDISIHALLAESDWLCAALVDAGVISIHALLAESDHKRIHLGFFTDLFLSTLSLRRATDIIALCKAGYTISIHALLAESDKANAKKVRFYVYISIHALLAESDVLVKGEPGTAWNISIHALLAESDHIQPFGRAYFSIFLSTLSLRRATCRCALCRCALAQFLSTLSLRRATARFQPSLSTYRYFYPRSPCGERPYCFIFIPPGRDFYPRSPCGERLPVFSWRCLLTYFYPRSPCGERHVTMPAVSALVLFLSTLSLRRATVECVICTTFLRISIHALLAESDWAGADCCRVVPHFYPRSPCGERRVLGGRGRLRDRISIHALLAESDFSIDWYATGGIIFLSTLSLRRATQLSISSRLNSQYFYPRSPCGERLVAAGVLWEIQDFYPRSPCGERPLYDPARTELLEISIHALLAESDLGIAFTQAKRFEFLSTLSLRRATVSAPPYLS